MNRLVTSASRVLLLLSAVLFCIYSPVSGQSKDRAVTHFNVKKNIALEGYDPVSYFKGTPVEGKSQLKVVHDGIIYFFSSQSNLKQFQANPLKYEPAYGGWCAYAMGETGEKVKVDPETFKIVDGKLYLFYNFWGNNTLSSWNKNENKLRLAADDNWRRLLD